MVKAIIDGVNIEVDAGTTILEAARKVNVHIPTLCYHPDLTATAGCGICVVQLEGRNNMLRACCTPVEEGMKIITKNPEIVEVRKNVLELILSTHPNECLTCIRNTNCELQNVMSDFSIREDGFADMVRSKEEYPLDDSTKSIVIDPRKCILCGRCVEVCQEIQNVWALSFLNRGIDTCISPAGGVKLADSPCIKCGQCVAHCPTGALSEYDQTKEVWGALLEKETHTVVQIAPAIRVAIGEAFGFAPGELLTGKLYAALRRIGFDAVFDTNIGADFTIMEEASEFVKRFTENDNIPLVTTCCPSWVDFMEKFYPELIPHFSSCKSPMQITGVLTKTYYAEKKGINPANIHVTAIMPCTSKKYEVQRHEEDMRASGFQDVDVSITTRELVRMLKQAGIDFNSLPEEEPDTPLGEYTGAGAIFGRSGGVMEAALRTAYHMITGKNMADLDIPQTQGLEGIKEFTIDVEGTKVNICVAQGTGNVEEVMKKIIEAKEKGEEPPYHFIEVMACPGGCIAGGGQPRGVTNVMREMRSKGLNKDDKAHAVRNSHENKTVQKIYEEFLGKPLGEKAHKLFHTHYTPRPTYKR